MSNSAVLHALSSAFAAAAASLSASAEKEEALAPSAGKPSKPAKAVAPAVPSISVGQVKEELTKVIKAKGKDAAIALLQAHGANKLSEVKPEEYAAVISEAAAALAPASDEDDI